MCRAGDTRVATELDRLARSLPDTRAIADEPTARQVRLNLGESVCDPTDEVGRLMLSVLAMVADFEAHLIRLRTREGIRLAKAEGHLRGKQPKLNRRQETHPVSLGALRGVQHRCEVAKLLDVFAPIVYRAIEHEQGRERAGADILATAS
ncbi:MAG: recombinase family protein [Mycobacteriales bacterium]